ncbi:MAG: YidC/Oxa1 family membrane protein insertase [Clostridia bacterium]|nr:YidC/Oxa1 family membrane protein insertase [Clostridia bacterium]MBQ5356403.1 YidC/Oxa1 family membrane protein insertase [Clostridia bacterium]
MESIFDILYIPMGYLLRFAYAVTHNYLLAIFLFTFVFEILLIPLAIKQQKNQIKQASLAPRTAAIRKKYAGREDQATKQKMQNEIMDMYQEEHFNPASGCGTLLIQFPIIICLYNVVTKPLRYISNLSTAQIASLKEYMTGPMGLELDIRNEQIGMVSVLRDNLSEFEAKFADFINGSLVLPDFKAGPFDLSKIPEISFKPFNWLMLIPVLTFVVMIVTQKIMKKFTYQDPTVAEQQNSMSMKIMEWTMPLFSVYIEFQMAAAIGMYWIFRNILQTVEKIIISKIFPLPTYTEADYKEAERVAGLSNKQKKREEKERDPNRKPVRSLHHIDDEEYLARHPEQLGPGEKAEEEKADSPKNTANTAPAPLKDDGRDDYRKK